MSPSGALAATYYVCTPSDTINPAQTTSSSNPLRWASNPQFRIGSSAFPSGSLLRNGLMWAIGEWNKGPQNLSLGTSFGTVAMNVADDKSDIYLDNGISASGAIGLATLRQSCSRGIIAADVRFTTTPGTGQTWDSNVAGLYLAYHGIGIQDFRAVALHELGHALGLGHEPSRYSIMGWSFNFAHANGISSGILTGLYTSPYLGADTTSGARTIYGTRSGSAPELSVSHWNYWKAGDGNRAGYSMHRFSRVIKVDNGNVPYHSDYLAPCDANSAGNGQTACAWKVNRGQLVDFEISVENNGGVSANNVATKVVISPDVEISTTDMLLDTPAPFNVPLGPPQVRKFRVKIPELPGGLYFLGVIIDPNNAVQEIQEDPYHLNAPPFYTGNATWVPVLIRS